jgi:hypothetical protein
MARQSDVDQSRHPDVSRLLISEPPLLVLPSLAIRVGLNEAIFLQQLHYWLLQSRHERDGRRWIYNTYDEWHTQLPFWSVRTIRRIVGGLEEQGLVLSTTKYNAQKVDQTKWYALDYVELARLTEQADQVDNLTTWPDQMANLTTSSGQPGQLDTDILAASVPETTTERTNRELEASNIRKASPELLAKYDDVRLALLPYAQDLARELNDQAPLAATTTRLVNLYRRADLDLDAFLTRLLQARAITQERTSAIRTQSAGLGPKPKLGYFFAVLEDLLGDAAWDAG